MQTGYVQGSSKEGAYSSEDYPQLIWTYPETVDITVTSPASSDNWQDYNTYSITWTSVGPISQVIIQLYKGATFVEDITFLYTDNDGDYSFYVSSSKNYNGTDYRIKITDYDDANLYDYSDYFTIHTDVLPVIPIIPIIPSYSTFLIIAIIGTFIVILTKKITNKINR